MDFGDVINMRHSVRQFTDDTVGDDVIEKLLRAALTAPSSKNCHSTSFIVVKEREQMAQMALMRSSGSAFLSGAQVAVIVCGDDSVSDIWVDNAAVSATVLQLAVVAESLGSCWIHVNGRFRSTNSEALASDYLRTVVSIPENLNPLCIIAIGHPVEGQNVVPHTDLYAQKVRG